MEQKTVKKIIALGYCHGCGACVARCPKKVIQLKNNSDGELRPEFVEGSLCVDCGLCLKVCRRVRELFGDNPLVNSGGLAPFREKLADEKVYAVHSTSDRNRRLCASGGFVTEFLGYLLETKRVSGVVVVERSDSDPLLSRAKIAETKEEVFAARGSKYSPVDYSDVFSFIRKSSANTRFAVVGLPCQIAGLVASLEDFPDLRRKVSIKVALVCGHTPSLRAYDYLLKKIKMKRENLQLLSNRGDGWPGYLSVTGKDGRVWRCPYGAALSWGMLLSSPFTSSFGCHFCSDPCGFNADLSVSDTWLPEYKKKENPGENLVWAHNESAREILAAMVENGVLESKEETFSRFVDANRTVFEKKTFLTAAAERYFLPREFRNERLNTYYDSMSFLQKLKLRALFFHVGWFRKLSRVIPISWPLLFYGKCLSWFCRKKGF